MPDLNLTDVFAAQQLLRERLHLLLDNVAPLLRADVELALAGRGKLLSVPAVDSNTSGAPLPAGVWPLLTLLVARQISPDVDPFSASSVAVAVECFVCAIDLLDDVMDEDQTQIIEAVGVARTLSVSTALLIEAQQAILSLSQRDISPPHILRLLGTLQESALITTTGQHRDVLVEHKAAHELTREDCIEIAATKGGSIMRLACRLGASCAGADDALCEQFSELGALLGIAHQLDNDSHDLYYLLQGDTSTIASTEAGTANKSVKSDLVRGKKTLPVVVAAETTGSLQQSSTSADEADEADEEYKRALYGGILSTWGICLLYRERAREQVKQIEALTQRSFAPALLQVLRLDEQHGHI